MYAPTGGFRTGKESMWRPIGENVSLSQALIGLWPVLHLHLWRSFRSERAVRKDGPLCFTTNIKSTKAIFQGPLKAVAHNSLTICEKSNLIVPFLAPIESLTLMINTLLRATHMNYYYEATLSFGLILSVRGFSMSAGVSCSFTIPSYISISLLLASLIRPR